MRNVIDVLLHESLAQIADFSLDSAAGTENSSADESIYATVRNSQEFTREQRAILYRKEIWPFDDETQKIPTEEEMSKVHVGEIAIFDVLGRYFPQKREVVLYTKVIRHVARSLKIPLRILTEIVLAHEIAHAVTHFGADENGAIWEHFEFASTEDLEMLAQLLPFVLFQQRGMKKHIAAMETLGTHQSSEYNGYRNHKDDSLASIRQLARDLRLNAPAPQMVAQQIPSTPHTNDWHVMYRIENHGWDVGVQKTIVYKNGSVMHFNSRVKEDGSYLRHFFNALNEEPKALPAKADKRTLKKIEDFLERSQIMHTQIDESSQSTVMDGASQSFEVRFRGYERTFYFRSHDWLTDEQQDMFGELSTLIRTAKQEAK